MSVVLWALLFMVPAYSADTDDIALYEAKAEQALKNGYNSRAVMYYTRIVRALDDNAGYRAKLAQIHLQMGELEKAREQASEILARDVKHKAALMVMSKVSLREKKFDEAYVYLQALVQNYPDEPYGYLGLSSVYSSRDDEKAEKDAFDAYMKLLSKNSNP
jgi:predicted Zn-dependent protease